MTVQSDPVLKPNSQPQAPELESKTPEPETQPETQPESEQQLEADLQQPESETQPEPEPESETPPPPPPKSIRLQQLEQLKKESADRTKALNKRIKAVENRESAEKRKLETREKILAGTVLFKLVATKQISQEVYLKALDTHLTTEHDRKVFGLTGGTQPEPKAKGKPK